MNEQNESLSKLQKLLESQADAALEKERVSVESKIMDIMQAHKLTDKPITVKFEDISRHISTNMTVYCRAAINELVKAALEQQRKARRDAVVAAFVARVGPTVEKVETISEEPEALKSEFVS